MRKVLLSIKPTFVEQIKKGSKRFEYRRRIFNDSKVTHMLIYASSPICKVVAECRIEEIHRASLSVLWNYTFQYSGISEDFYQKYFEGLEEGFAIEIAEVKFFDEPKLLHDYHVKRAPQSFCYVDD